MTFDEAKPLPGETKLPDDEANEEPDEPAVPEPDEQPKTDEVEE